MNTKRTKKTIIRLISVTLLAVVVILGTVLLSDNGKGWRERNLSLSSMLYNSYATNIFCKASRSIKCLHRGDIVQSDQGQHYPYVIKSFSGDRRFDVIASLGIFDSKYVESADSNDSKYFTRDGKSLIYDHWALDSN